MNYGSEIEWCDETWEVTAGCTRVSEGCRNCYAERLMSTRMHGFAAKRKAAGIANGSAIDISLEVVNAKQMKWNGQVRELPMNLEQPLRRKKPTVYFVNSRSDLFHERVDFAYIDRVYAVMALCPQHRFLVLSKRPERMKEYLSTICDRDTFDAEIVNRVGNEIAEHCPNPARPFDRSGWPLPNVWLGTSVEDQATADARVPELLACPAAGRFVSAEPLLGAVDLDFCPDECPRCGYTQMSGMRDSIDEPFSWYCSAECCSDEYPLNSIDWVIVGGESGPGARGCNIDWIRSIQQQCQSAGVPVFVKQLGAVPFGQFEHEDNEGYGVSPKLKNRKGADMSEWPEDMRVREVPNDLRIGVTPC